MTIDEIRASDKEVLTPGDVAEVLRSGPQTIRILARQRPDLLGFPVILMGSRVKIPRRAFLSYMGDRGEPEAGERKEAER